MVLSSFLNDRKAIIPHAARKMIPSPIKIFERLLCATPRMAVVIVGVGFFVGSLIGVGLEVAIGEVEFLMLPLPPAA